VPHFNSLLGVIACKYPDKLYLFRTRRIVLPEADNHTIVSSFVWTQYRNVTDGQTDRMPLAVTALRIASNADAL